jgi:hypothetical protein
MRRLESRISLRVFRVAVPVVEGPQVARVVPMLAAPLAEVLEEDLSHNKRQGELEVVVGVAHCYSLERVVLSSKILTLLQETSYLMNTLVEIHLQGQSSFRMYHLMRGQVVVKLRKTFKLPCLMQLRVTVLNVPKPVALVNGQVGLEELYQWEVLDLPVAFLSVEAEGHLLRLVLLPSSVVGLVQEVPHCLVNKNVSRNAFAI